MGFWIWSLWLLWRGGEGGFGCGGDSCGSWPLPFSRQQEISLHDGDFYWVS